MTTGTGDKVKGRIEKAAGDLTGDDRLRDRGSVDEAAGNIKQGVNKGVDAVKDAATGRRPKDRNTK
jgi:uncharacterized protein YjbJ (UPF0337 family)